MYLKFTQGFCLFVLFVCSSLSKSFSQDGKVDSSFGTYGRVWNPQANFVLNNASTLSPRILVTADQKILHLSNTTSGLLLVRYLPDGDLDVSFGSGGMKTIPSASVYDAILLPDQKFLVLTSRTTITRFTANGDPDPGFDGDGIVTLPAGISINGFAVQADGKVVAAGSGSLDGDQVFTTVRFNADGSLDNSFDGDGIAQFNFNPGTDYASVVAVQTDGKIVVAGIVLNYVMLNPPIAIYGYRNDVGLIRYLPDGSLDTDFGEGGKVTLITGSYDDEIRRVLIQPDGKIVVAGDQFYYTDITNAYFFADRFLSNGDLDLSFNGGSPVFRVNGNYAVVTDAAIQADGKILIAGYPYCIGNCSVPGFQDFIVLRLSSNGTRDASFKGDNPFNVSGSIDIAYMPVTDGGIGTYSSIEWGNSLASQGNRLLLGGFATIHPGPSAYKALLIRLNNSSPIISRNPITFYRDQDKNGG